MIKEKETTPGPMAILHGHLVLSCYLPSLLQHQKKSHDMQRVATSTILAGSDEVAADRGLGVVVLSISGFCERSFFAAISRLTSPQMSVADG